MILGIFREQASCLGRDLAEAPHGRLLRPASDCQRSDRVTMAAVNRCRLNAPPSFRDARIREELRLLILRQ